MHLETGKEKVTENFIFQNNLNDFKLPISLNNQPRVGLEDSASLELQVVHQSIDIAKNYHNGDVLPIKFTVKSASKVTVTFNLYKGSTLISSSLKEEFNVQTTQSETRVINYTIQDLRSGTYTLKLVAQNTKGESAQKTLPPFSVEYSTFIQTLFVKPKYSTGDKILIKGTFQEVSSTQAIFFAVKFGEDGNEILSQPYIPNGQRQEFVIEAIATKAGFYNCSVYAKIGELSTSPSYVSIIISDRPKLVVTPNFTGSEFDAGSNLSFSLLLTDDSKGNIIYAIDGNESFINYSVNVNKTIPLSINLGQSCPYRKQPYLLTIYARDKYGIQTPDPKYSLIFTVLSKPKLVDLQIPLRADPGQVFNLNFTVDDKDNGKKLYLFAKGFGTANTFREKYGPVKSNGQKGQKHTLVFNYPSVSDRYNTSFTVTSRLDFIETSTENSDSNVLNYTILSSEVPNLEVQWPTDTVFTSDEKIELDLTATDDNNGTITYYYNGNEYNSDSSAPSRYEAKVKTHIALSIPSYVTYRSENSGLNNLTIVLTDDFGLRSQPATLKFNIRNKLNITSVNVQPLLLREENKSKAITFTVYYDNVDHGRNISLFIQEGTGQIYHWGQRTRSGKGLIVQGTQAIASHTNMNFPITFWFEDDNVPDRNTKNRESNKYVVYVNITRTPNMTSNCPSPRSFNSIDPLTVSMLINDDTNGHIKFFINSEDINQDYFYNTTDGVSRINPTITFPPGDKFKYGKYNLTYYPVDEFGVDPIEQSKKRDCPIEYRSKPILSNCSLSKTQADNDDIVYASGKIIDYDVGKTLYIFQQIQGQSPMIIGNLTTVKAGEVQSFNLSLRNIVMLTSGSKTIDIFVCDHNETTGLDPLSFSNYSHLTIFMANDPDIIVTFPTEQIYSPDETFNIIINVTADLSGTIKIYNAYPYSWYSPQSTINYNKSGIYTGTFICQTSQYSTSQTVYVLAVGQNNTKSKMYQFPIKIRKALKLDYVKMSSRVLSPGETLTLNPKIMSGYSSDIYYATDIYVFVKIGGTLYDPEKRPDHDAPDDYAYSVSPQIPLDAKSAKNVKVVVWAQYEKDPKNPGKNSKSNEWTSTIIITKTPEVDFNFPMETQYYGYDDEFRANVVIYDDSKGTVKVTARQRYSYYSYYGYDNYHTYTIYTTSYSTSSSGSTTTVDLNFKINKTIKYSSSLYNTLYFTITVTDEYGKQATSYEKTFYLINKPVINSFTFTDKSVALQKSYISAKVTFTDLDVSKYLYFYYSINGAEYKYANDYITSNGKQQINTLQLYIPSDAPLGMKSISIMIKTISSGRNANSEESSNSIIITFKPSYTLDNLPEDALYSDDGLVPITGTLKCDGYAKLILTVGTIELKRIILDPKTLTNGRFKDSFKVPAGLSYGTINVYSKLVDSNDNEATAKYTLSFLHKNKPVITDLSLYNDVLSPYGPWSFSVVCQDPDNGKKLYLYGQIGDEEPLLFTDYGVSSIGSSQTIYASTPYGTFTQLYGKQTFKLWLSDTKNSTIRTGLGVSDIFARTVIFSYVPDFSVTYPDSHYYTSGATVQASYTMKDDGKVTLKVYIDEEEIKDLAEDIELDNTERTGTKNIKLPDDLTYGKEHNIMLTYVDHYGFQPLGEFLYFHIVNQPNLTKASFVKPFALQSEVIEFEGYFNDFDKDKYLYVFVQLGDKLISSETQKIQSNGTANQKFQFGYEIPGNESIGNKTVTIWMLAESNYYPSLDPLLSSNKVESVLFITYKPSLSLKPIVKNIYNDGDQITIIGSIRANSNVNMHFMIDSVLLNDTKKITVSESPQEFEVKVGIPVNFKHGKHKMNVWAVDVSGQNTSNFALDFNIQNPPKLLSVSVAKDRVRVGGKLKVLGTVRDPDVGNNISFIVSIDEGKQEPSYTLQSDSTVQDFSFVYQIPQSLEVGDHQLTLLAIDTDNLVSSPAIVQFTVYKSSVNDPENPNDPDETGGDNADSKKANTKKKNNGNVGLIVGIVIVGIILLVLCVLAVILLIQRKKNSHPDSASDNSDIEERETQISTNISLEETATKDNPLFSSETITQNNDPFSDEFEESQKP
ncbi:hypothetical protein TVAGG3_0749560 [Trichomonas vaginalis G3]|uniref:hypothetical protein n=2 Tax=Trichomonas vaginalis (strain ATCC PRA-98 / G3) TaxID=412133 RepID=UPI0021E611B4|nr:hypothetical protein TVAGG3_0749560 [Trichomonas vaginalis G3]KAI5512436.1 hypothetical protein TVAGG3_0749560 [Trichomonas vaginalis G3]